MTSVRVENLTKKFGDTLAVDAIDFTIADGELATLLGPSGCGKSTTLRCIVGLEEADEGSIYFGDRRMNDVPVANRNIGLLFQRLALFPHMKVFDNVAFGLRMKGVAKDEIARRVKDNLALVQMSGYENRYPRQLSGGQQQRVALARTMVTDPEILLFDEPLSSLDAKLREELKLEIRRLHRQTGKTTIYVTHDQGEAFAISDQIYVMNAGRLEQSGTPLDLYMNPTSPFVASFIGTHNFVPAKVSAVVSGEPRSIAVHALGCEVTADYEEGVVAGDDVTLLIRPEDIVAVTATEAGKTISGEVQVSTFSGASTYLEVKVNGHVLKASLFGESRFKYMDAVGQEIGLQIRRCSVIPRGKVAE